MYTKHKLANLSVCLAGILCFGTVTAYLNNASLIANASTPDYQNAKNINIHEPNDSSSNSMITNDSRVETPSRLAPKLQPTKANVNYDLQWNATYSGEYGPVNTFKRNEKITK